MRWVNDLICFFVCVCTVAFLVILVVFVAYECSSAELEVKMGSKKRRIWFFKCCGDGSFHRQSVVWSTQAYSYYVYAGIVVRLSIFGFLSFIFYFSFIIILPFFFIFHFDYTVILFLFFFYFYPLTGCY